ncbi:MAG: flippase-like domain-containing protein [Rhodocyclaceae bacterium]|nr:flippase-like domain-containing protein [Rhodocyclaceae bacterium]
MGLLAGIVLLLDWQSLRARFASMQPGGFGLAVLLGVLANLISAWRWRLISTRLGLVAPALAFYLAYGKGVTLNAVLPGATLGGDAYRAFVLHRQGNALLASALSVALDRLTGLWGLFVLSACAWIWLFLTQAPNAEEAHAALHLSALLCAICAPFLAARLCHLFPPSSARWLARSLRLLTETAHMLRVAFWPSLAVQLASIGALAACLSAVGLSFSFLYLIAIAAPIFLAAALPISIGGFGTREAVLAAYFALAGLPLDAALAGGFLTGLATTVQGILWAPLFLFAADHATPASSR